MKALRLTLILQQPSYQVLLCINDLTDDETFGLWDGSNFIFATHAKQN